MNILAIDDNQDIIKLLKTVLTSEGFDFIGVNNGKEGLNKIREQQYDLVLLDIAMPGYSGEDLVNELHEDGMIKKQKIVLFTASAVPQERIDSMISKGVHSCLRKPADIDKIIDLVKKSNE